MASISNFLCRAPTLQNPSQRTPNVRLSSAVRVPILGKKENWVGKRLRVSAGLIEPDGGKLVDLVVEKPLRDQKRLEALSVPRIKLSRIDLEWVHVLSEGWASPLRGFMRESEFLQTLHFNSLRLDDGSLVNMSVPIVLAIDEAQKREIGEAKKVALVDSRDKPIAILSE